MPTRSYIHSRSGSRDGVALIMVLAFIVLLSILIVSFIAFSRLNKMATVSYSKSIQAQEVAQGGLQDILTDLHQEIIAGSLTGSAYTQNGTTVYPPSTNWTASPARFGYAASLYGNEMTNSLLLPPTLVRVSRASQDGVATDFYPTLPSYYTSGLLTNRASAANSSTNSANGRSISAARWNKIQLLYTNSTLPAAFPFATNTPDWIYVTRGGSRACSLADVTNPNSPTYILPSKSLTSTSQVIGRYAYVVYDEGALIDINSAGYISNATNNYTFLTNYAPANSYSNPTSGVTQVLTGKSYSAYADLTQIPGITNQASVDSLIKWRNASVSMSTAASAGTNYYQMVANNATNGFLVASTTANGSDSPILGRLDLLNYLASTNGAAMAAAAPYLGTFSRAANAPSWHPTSDAANLPGAFGASTYTKTYNYNTTVVNGNVTNTFVGTGSATTTFNSSYIAPANYTYKTSAETTGSINRDLPNVRYPAAATITHYNDDGTSYTYNVNAGDPVVQHRFSLAKLAWLGSSGPNAAAFNSSLTAAQRQAAILACFGLVWDGENFSPSSGLPHYDRWDYVANTTGPTAIMTLDQVANTSTSVVTSGSAYGITLPTLPTLPREPNFFECLKAGILSGSLGQSPGPAPSSTATYSPGAEGMPAVGLDTYNIEKNRHILQIGANIIDQYDSDSIPTAIYLPLFGAAPPATSLTTEADLAFNTVYGDENLPGLTRVTMVYIEDYYNASLTNGYFKLWTHPEIWNVHQVPPTGADMTVAGTPGYPHPTEFRLHAFGEIGYHLAENGGGATYFSGSGTGADPGSIMGGKGQTNTFQPMNYDDTTTPYTYHEYSDGLAQTVTGGQTPSDTTVSNGIYPTTSPAGLLYFLDYGSAVSPFYRFPDFLQFNNSGYLYKQAGATYGPRPYSGTHTLNLSSYNPQTPVYYNDYGIPSDGANPTMFAALFGGEYILPDMSTGVGLNIQENIKAITPFYMFLECQDPTTNRWHPSSYIGALYGNATASAYNAGANNNVIVGDNSNGIPASPNSNFYGTCPATVSTSHAANGISNQGVSGRGGCLMRIDPRTDRFSVAVSRMHWNGAANTTLNYQPNVTAGVEDSWPLRTWGFVYTNPGGGGIVAGTGQGTDPVPGFGGSGGARLASWAFNVSGSTDTANPTALPTLPSDAGAGVANVGSYAYYLDPDGVVRPGDSYRATASGSGNSTTGTGDGFPMYHGIAGAGDPPTVASGKQNATLNTTPASLLPTDTSASGYTEPIGSAQARRPMILNRPFRNVGELGYTFRDLPFKSIDFFSKYSGDAALLDLFSVADEASLSGGEIDLSSAPTSELTAILSGATKMEIDSQYAGKYDSGATGVTTTYPTGVSATNGAPNFMTQTEAAIVASQLTSSFSLTNSPSNTTGPIGNRADLVTRLEPILNYMSAPTTATPAGLGYLDYANKAYAEAPIRALAGITNTRTWNLLIDIIAQSGQMSPTATSLDNFVVQGERRYWLHIAIDRYTGKILDQQLEPIYE